MHCLAYCLIGIVLISGMIAVMINKDNNTTITFKNSLSDEQLQVYRDIHIERRNVYIQGLILGVILALVVNLFSKERNVTGVCITTAIVFGVAYLYYLVRPKKMMLDYLETNEQIKLYTDVYRDYQKRNTVGMIVGAGGFAILLLGLSLLSNK